jgi:hypothetical protein
MIEKVRIKLQGYEIYFPIYPSPYKTTKVPAILAMCAFVNPILVKQVKQSHYKL